MGVVVVAVVAAVIVGRMVGDSPGVPRDIAGVLVCAHRLIEPPGTFWHERRP
jgi:hypothetical protein